MLTKPNFLVFMTDHQQAGTLLPGSQAIMPNADIFRASAVNFTRAYCPAPHCCPSRATFFTGQYPSVHGVWNNVYVSNALSRGIRDGAPVFLRGLRDAGYRTALCGKWHISATRTPEDYGCEWVNDPGERANMRAGVPEIDTRDWRNYDRPGVRIDKDSDQSRDGIIARPGYSPYTIYGEHDDLFNDGAVVDAAASRLHAFARKNEPFFLFCGTLGPHDPYYPPKRCLDLYDIDQIKLPENFADDMRDKPAFYRRTRDRFAQMDERTQKECLRRYLASCTYQDELFGYLLSAARDEGLLENTIVCWLSDHGDYAGAHGLWTKGVPCFREAYNVCAMIGGCVRGGGRSEDALVSLADFAPTFLSLAGAPIPEGTVGRSLAPFLRGEKPDAWRDACFTQTNGNESYGIQRAVWTDKWKYVMNGFDYDELYDLENDPLETRNLLAGIADVPKSVYAPVVRDMCLRLWRFAYENKDNSVNPYIATAFAPYGPGIIFQEGKP